jgi:hypothetical protein
MPDMHVLAATFQKYFIANNLNIVMCDVFCFLLIYEKCGFECFYIIFKILFPYLSLNIILCMITHVYLPLKR